MEVYGTKPTRFTKEWWEYFWDYYKWHTICTIIAIIVVVSSITECANRVNYDLQADLISENEYYSVEMTEELNNLMSEVLDDATGNGKIETYLNYINMGDMGDPQANQAMQTKFMMEAGYSEGYVFILSKKYADYFKDSGIFVKASEWTDKESYDGYLVSTVGSAVFEKLGMDKEELYVAVSIIRGDNKKDKFAEAKQKNGLKLANYLVNER